MIGLIVIFAVFAIIGGIVSNQLKSRFKKYGKIQLSSGLSGREIAEKMLNESGIHDVKIISVQGHLTDHYNPVNKTVNLSPEVYNGSSIAAAAVAAHECGHAVQHATAYRWLTLRSKLVPVVQISSQFMSWIFIAMMFMGYLFQQYMMQFGLAIIIAQAAITLFTLVTLPVEFDASNRALAWLDRASLTQKEEHAKAADALKWAARTYLVAALAAVAQLLYFILSFLGNDD
jgi:Zn-dependent membrane protease YugP